MSREHVWTETVSSVVMRAFGRHLVIEPYLACAILDGRVVASMARPDQRETWLPGLMDGRLRLALAQTPWLAW